MRENRLKVLLSYLTEVYVESVASDINQELTVFLKNGRYQLCTKHAIYSYADKYQNFRESFSKINLPNRDNVRVLLLGFGMGSIPYTLEKIFKKNYIYTGIEIDPSIIYLASKYVLSDLESDITIIEVDAANYLDQNTQSYDLICIDIFVDDKIPTYFLSETFILEVSRAISEDGIVLFNHLGYTQKDKIDAKNYFDQTFSKVFAHGAMMQVHKNYMMINRKVKIK